jgi:ER-bound oxygenase mpaB/B'/Rubber oxygenase, catalytic domain
MGRRGVVEEIEGLDPERDFERISFLSTNHDFPWDVEQSLSLAFFKTYGIPTISELLDRTGEFRERAQRRYDDTELILAEILDNGIDSNRGRKATGRMNRMHGRFPIRNEDYLYVLATFVLVPLRWNRKYGWRRYTRQEELATLNYWHALGRRMNIRDIPDTIEKLEAWSDEFERTNLRFSESSRHVADDTLGLFLSWYPALLRPLIRPAVLALLDDELLDAFGYRHPPAWLRSGLDLALRARARIVARLPRRRRPHLITQRRHRGYPGGYRLEQLGVPGLDDHPSG